MWYIYIQRRGMGNACDIITMQAMAVVADDRSEAGWCTTCADEILFANFARDSSSK